MAASCATTTRDMRKHQGGRACPVLHEIMGSEVMEKKDIWRSCTSRDWSIKGQSHGWREAADRDMGGTVNAVQV